MKLPPGFVLEQPTTSNINLPPGFELETAAPVEKQSIFRQVADVPLGIAKGAVQGVRMIADVFGAGSETSNTIRSAENYLADLMSAQAKNDQQAIARIMKEAEDKGVVDQVLAGVKAFTVAPVDTLSTALGTAAPVIAGALGAKLLGAGALVGTGVGVLTGAGMGAGVVKGSIYDETKKALLEAGASEQEAERRAQLAQEYRGQNLDQILLGTVLGGAAAAGPLEKGAAGILARRILSKAAVEETGEAAVAQAAKGAVRRRLEAGAKEALPEMAQAGQEQVAQNIALQREGFDVPTMRGAVSAATLEGIAGGALGAGLGGGRPEIAPPQAEVTPPAAPPAEPTVPPTLRERVEEVTGVTAPPAEVAPMTAEEAEAAGAARQREIAERARIGRLQQMAEADMEAQAERARREGIAPVTPPRAETPERTVPPLAEREMPQATPMEELRAKQADVDRRRLEAGLPTGESSMFPGFQPRPPLEAEPEKPAEPVLVDERPMTEKAAKNRLLVLKNLYKNAGRDPESIDIVPHPTVPERFAIQSLDRPVKLTPGLPETAAGKEPSPKVLDPVEAYVNIQRRTNTDAARRFVQDWEAGRITRADVEQALEQEKKAGRPPALTYTAEGEREIEPSDQYKPRGERFVPPPAPPKPPVAEEPPTPPQEPPGEEPPPTTTEPPKTLGEFKQRLPVSSDNAKLRAANNNGSFEDLANTLAASSNPVTARVGELAKKIATEVRLLKPKNLGRGIAGVYNRMTDTVQMAPGYVADEWVNTHEVVHALVARSQVNPTPRQKPIVKQLDDLYEYVYKETKRRGINPKTMYGLTNSREFASEAMSNQEFQFYLMSIPYKGKRSAWTEFTRIVANLLGIKNTNALSEAINLVDRIAQTKRAPFSTSMFGVVDYAVEPGQPPVLDTSDIKDMKGRHKQMTAAARLLRDGKISRAEYDQYVNFYKPIATIDMGKLDAPATNDNMFQTVDSNKQDKINAPIADGEKVGLRMDLPARDRGIAKGINGAVVSIHEGNSGKATQGKVKSFQSAAYIKDVTFEPRSQKKGLGIAAGEAKQPLQTVEGTFFNVAPDEIFKRIKSLSGTDGWVQVGFDPTRHGYFYDRETKQPVVSASEMYQVGNFLLAKDVKYAPTEEFDYAPAREEAEAEREPLAADATPQEILNFMGIKPQKQEEGVVERTKRLRAEFKEDPELTKSSIAKAVKQFKDKMENNVFSADAAFNNKVRSELIKDIDQNKDVLGTLIEISQSQTVHSDAVAGVFIQMGGLRYDNDAKKWVGFQEENNFINLSRKIDDIAKKYSLPRDEAQRVAHAYFVAKRLRSLQDRNAEIETKIANLPKGDPEIKKLEKGIVQIHLDDDQIQAGLDLEKRFPELKSVVSLWNGIRSNTVKLLVQSGMWTDEFANAMLDNIDYVPFYREEQLEEGEGPAEFVRGLQVKAKEFRIKGSENPVNDVFDNMVRWTQYAVNRAIRNHKSLQLIDTALEIDVDDGKMAEKVKEPKKGESIVRVFRDGKQEYYRMADPLFMDAFLPVQNVTMPSLKIFSWFANLLRQSVVLFPLFSVAQVPQDAFAAMFTSGLQPRFALKIPFLAVKEYVQTLTKTSALHNQLKRYGVVGVRDFSSSVIRDDAEIMAGLKPQQTWWGKTLAGLQHISMSADNAVRQAVYDAAMQQGLTKAEALEKAFEIINFRRKPKSLALNIAGQTVPFFYAYLAAQRVAYNTLSGVGISPQERKAGLKTLMYTSAAVMALSMLYAMLNEDDEDYRDTPTALRDRTITIPGTGGVRIPLRVDFFLLPKVIAEHTYHALVENGMTDKTKFRTSMKDAVLSSILAPGPFPQAVKAPIEVAINYDFYQGRPLIGFFDQKKDAERQFNLNTSEFAKVVGSTGLISPVAVDHLMRGMFGSVGGLFLWGTNKMINTFGPDIERPAEDWQDAIASLPSAGAFLKKSTQSALKNDFYQLRDEVEKAKNTFNDYKNYSPEGIEEFIANEDKMAKLALSKQVEKISDQLSKVRKAIKQVTMSPMMTDTEKQDYIRELRQVEKEMLQSVDVPALRKAAGL